MALSEPPGCYECSCPGVCLDVYFIFISLGYIPRSAIADSHGNSLCLTLCRTAGLLLHPEAAPFQPSPAGHEGSDLPVPFLARTVTACLFKYSHPSGAEGRGVRSHCGSDLRFRND